MDALNVQRRLSWMSEGSFEQYETNDPLLHNKNILGGSYLFEFIPVTV